jgi:hypothetical protein
MSYYSSLEKCINDCGLRTDLKTNLIQFTKQACNDYNSKNIEIPKTEWFSAEYFESLLKPVKGE